jgi:hypothetical protein
LVAFGVLTTAYGMHKMNSLNPAPDDNAEGNQPTTDNAAGNQLTTDNAEGNHRRH